MTSQSKNRINSQATICLGNTLRPTKLPISAKGSFVHIFHLHEARPSSSWVNNLNEFNVCAKIVICSCESE